MKAFWIKVINIAVICLILFVYQSAASSNARMASSIADLNSTLEEQEEAEGRYKDGVYEGTGTGYNGDIRVEVTVEEGEIASIDIVDISDDAAYYNKALALTGDILDKQTTDGVDTVSGATFSSKGILEAVDDALKGAE